MLPVTLASPIPLAELAPLNRYAVEARYPIGEEPLTGEEARSAIDIARRLRAFVLRAVAPDSSWGEEACALRSPSHRCPRRRGWTVPGGC